MELKGTDRFIVNRPTSLISDYHTSLAVLYLPLIGSTAHSLYYVLLAQKGDNDINYLCQTLDKDIDKVTKALISLEQYQLVRSFINKTTKVFRFELSSPLTCSDFLNHVVFGRMFLKSQGERLFASLSNRFSKEKNSGDDLELTSNFDLSLLKGYDIADEDKFNRLKENLYEKTDIKFDINKFLRGLNTIAVPLSVRTDENLKLIAQMGTVYGVDEETMKRNVARSLDKETYQFDPEKLRDLCLISKKKDVLNQERTYDMPPVDFLYNLQSGVNVTSSDKKIIETLKTDYHLSDEVTNYLLEYVFENNNKRISWNYTEQIAKDWLIHKVNTLEDAKGYVNKGINKRSSAPDFVLETNNNVESQNLQQLRAQLFREDN